MLQTFQMTLVNLAYTEIYIPMLAQDQNSISEIPQSQTADKPVAS